ncbi:MAG: LegC family aminotransferase [Rhodospirillales bacterium]
MTAESVLHAVQSVCGAPAALHEPVFEGRERDYVKDCLDTGWVSTAGAYVEKFESMLCEITGAGHAAAVVNGTAALRLCYQLVGVRAGDEVIVPALTFAATANAAAHLGAVPHFADCEDAALGLDPAALDKHLGEIIRAENGAAVNRRTGRRIAACAVTHVFGHPARVTELAEVCARYDIALVEDAAESLGSYFEGRHLGRFGRIGALSFNGNKIVTAGGGGAVITDNAELAARAKHLSTTAKVPHPWNFTHDEVGYNDRMPNINAALGCAQLEQLEDFLNLKRALAAHYRKAFAGLNGVHFVDEPPGAKSNFWLNAVLTDGIEARDAVLAASNKAGFQTRPAWDLLHTLPMYADNPRADLKTAEWAQARAVTLPSGVGVARTACAAGAA